MVTALQVGAVPISGQQAGVVSFQAGALPATTAQQIDMNAIVNMMMMMMVMVMMMKMMTGATAKM